MSADKLDDGKTAIQSRPRPGAYLLENTRGTAEYWLNAARNVEDRDEAVLAIEQVANCWKNAAYDFAEKLHFSGYLNQPGAPLPESGKLTMRDGEQWVVVLHRDGDQTKRGYAFQLDEDETPDQIRQELDLVYPALAPHSVVVLNAAQVSGCGTNEAAKHMGDENDVLLTAALMVMEQWDGGLDEDDGQRFESAQKDWNDLLAALRDWKRQKDSAPASATQPRDDSAPLSTTKHA